MYELKNMNEEDQILEFENIKQIQVNQNYV